MKESGPPAKKQATLTSMVHKPNFDMSNAYLEKFLLTSGVSFHALRNPYLNLWAKSLCSTYEIPSEYKLKGPLFENELEEIQAWKQDQYKRGLMCITGDGLTNQRRVGLCNIEVLSCFGPIHHNIYERTWETVENNAHHIAAIFNSAITEVGGPEVVVGIVTDNESKMRQVWNLVEEANKGLIALPCSAHIGSLLMKDIIVLLSVKPVLDNVQRICSNILNHNYPLALFRNKVAQHKEMNKKDLKLPCKTRYGSHFQMVDRAVQLKAALREMAVDPLYEACDAYDPEIQALILCPNFWQSVDQIFKVMEPVYRFIRFADSANPDVGKAYTTWRDMGSQVLNSGSSHAQQVHRCFEIRTNGTNRKIGFHHPAHTCAMLVHPHNWDVNFQEKYNHDYGKMRRELVLIFEQVSRTPEDAATAILQYDSEFKSKRLGYFQSMSVQMSAKGCTDPSLWWEHNGAEIPQLQYVARRVLSLKLANSAAERNWSIHGFLNSKQRSRQSFQTQRKLVDVYVNLKLRDKMMTKKSDQYSFGSESEESGDEEVESDHEVLLET